MTDSPRNTYDTTPARAHENALTANQPRIGNGAGNRRDPAARPSGPSAGASSGMSSGTFSTTASGVGANEQAAAGAETGSLRDAAHAPTRPRMQPSTRPSTQPGEEGSGSVARQADSACGQAKGVRLTGQRFFGGLFVLFVAIPLVYLGGFLAGRSALEEELMQASHMPKSARPSEDGRDAGEGQGRSMTGGERGKEPEDADDGILRPQDLAFARFLRAAPGEKVPEPRPLENLPPAVPTEESAQPAMAPGMSPASATGGPPEKPAQAASLYDFVFQVAAFRRQEDAENARIQIEAEGFRSRLEHNGSLYLVLLLSRGPLSRVDEIKEVTARLRLGAPIERSRKAVLLPIGQREPGA